MHIAQLDAVVQAPETQRLYLGKSVLEDAKQLAELKVENDDVLALTYQLSGICSCQMCSVFCASGLNDVSALMQMDHGKMLTLPSMCQKWTAVHTANTGNTESRGLLTNPHLDVRCREVVAQQAQLALTATCQTVVDRQAEASWYL